jgi:hypothetical protein
MRSYPISSHLTTPTINASVDHDGMPPPHPTSKAKTTWAVRKKNERGEDGRWKMGSCGGDEQRQRLHPPVDQQHTDSIR